MTEYNTKFSFSAINVFTGTFTLFTYTAQRPFVVGSISYSEQEALVLALLLHCFLTTNLFFLFSPRSISNPPPVPIPLILPCSSSHHLFLDSAVAE